MLFTMTTPCPKCPFRTDVTPYIRAARAREIADGITRRQGTFTCHQTTVAVENSDGDTDMIDGPNAQHCAGAMIMLEHMNQPNQMMRICERIRQYDRTKLDMDAPVYRSTTAFIRAHQRRERRK